MTVKIEKLRVFILSCVLVLSSQLAANAAPIPLDEALKDGKVKISITGLGGSTGDTILLTVQRKIQKALRKSENLGTPY